MPNPVIPKLREQISRVKEIYLTDLQENSGEVFMPEATSAEISECQAGTRLAGCLFPQKSFV